MSSRALADLPPEIRVTRPDESSYNGSTNDIFYSSSNGGRVMLQPVQPQPQRPSMDRTPIGSTRRASTAKPDDVEKRFYKVRRVTSVG